MQKTYLRIILIKTGIKKKNVEVNNIIFYNKFVHLFKTNLLDANKNIKTVKLQQNKNKTKKRKHKGYEM